MDWIRRRKSSAALCAIAMLPALLSSCAKEKRGDRKTTVPVSGQVYVDGQPPSSPIQIECINKNGIDQAQPSFSKSMTGEDGKFQISTYETGDGVPPGDYALTFTWGQLNLISGRFGGPDKLNGKYDDIEESPVEFTVDDSKETVDLGRIELTTSPPKK